MSIRVRFIGENLVVETGEILEIPFEQLKEACLNSEFETLSIFDIVNEGVKICTGGYDVVKGKYQESTLYNKLQSAIIHDERYQEKKLKKQAYLEKIREAGRLATQEKYSSFQENPYIRRKQRKNMRDYYLGKRMY